MSAGADWLDSREFYELMQEYRHDPIGSGKYFEKVKSAIRLHTVAFENDEAQTEFLASVPAEGVPSG